ncbi:MAG: alpha/beta fold hydrolase, partial [Janthinobacterium lividum]
MIDRDRRHVLGVAAAAFAVAELGIARPARAVEAPDPTFRLLKQIDAGVLDTGYVDAGVGTDPVVILLHGWPYDIHSFAEVVPLLVEAGYRVIVPFLRGFGTTLFRSNTTIRNAQQSVFAND